jgi:hypothetical protein
MSPTRFFDERVFSFDMLAHVCPAKSRGQQQQQQQQQQKGYSSSGSSYPGSSGVS